MILMIDNYDSFTYNLVQYLRELGETVQVYRNDEIELNTIESLNPSGIVISPGPCTPNEAGISLKVVETFAADIPILGVCLGHQSIGQAFGAKIITAKKIVHGKTSSIYHSGRGIFSNIPSPFTATRYHSLIVDASTLPDCFEITAWTQDENEGIDEIMGIKHQELPLEGIQFHPESILTEYGKPLLQNFLSQAIIRI